MNTITADIREKFAQEVRALYRQFRKQRLSEDEFKFLICNLQERLLKEALPDCDVNRDLNSLQWERLQADHDAREKGRSFDETVGEEWLRIIYPTYAGPTSFMKGMFFDVRRALCLGIKAFEPVPENIEKPAIGLPLYKDSMRIMRFPCAKLAELFTVQPSPVTDGERVFTLENGIELHIVLESVAVETAYTTLICSGYITDYMPSKDRTIEITKLNGNDEIFVTFTYQNEEELRYFYDRPRFKAYVDYVSSRREKAMNENLEKVYAEIINEPAAE